MMDCPIYINENQSHQSVCERPIVSRAWALSRDQPCQLVWETDYRTDHIKDYEINERSIYPISLKDKKKGQLNWGIKFYEKLAYAIGQSLGGYNQFDHSGYGWSI